MDVHVIEIRATRTTAQAVCRTCRWHGVTWALPPGVRDRDSGTIAHVDAASHLRETFRAPAMTEEVAHV